MKPFNQRHTMPLKVVRERDNQGYRNICIMDSRNLAIANMVMDLTGEEKAKADYIIRAVNIHDELIQALEAIRDYANPLAEIDKATIKAYANNVLVKAAAL